MLARRQWDGRALIFLLLPALVSAQSVREEIRVVSVQGPGSIPISELSGVEMIPLRGAASFVGATVRPGSEPGAVTISGDGKMARVSDGRNFVPVEASLVLLQSPARLVSGEWFVPLDFLTKVLPSLSSHAVTFHARERMLILGEGFPQLEVRSRRDPNYTRVEVVTDPPVPLEVEQLDGRDRGRLPLTVPVRVLPGQRTLRIIAAGYITFERSVDVVAKQTLTIEAALEPLADAGLLRIQDATVPGSRVFIDGTAVGTTPWEGTLGPGPHLVWTTAGDNGSAPRRVIVVQGQTAIVEIRSEPLGEAVTISVLPKSATLSIDDVDIGSSSYRGRLPRGTHTIVASEDGYHPSTERFDTTSPVNIAVELVVDPSHPRWPPPAAGRAFIQAAVGYALGASLASEAQDNCSACPSAPLVHGFELALRGGYRFGVGLSLELAAGYLRLTSTFERTLPTPGPLVGALELTDDLLVHGPFAAFGVGYRHALSEALALTARAHGGALLSAASDAISGDVSFAGQRAPVSIADPSPVSRSGVLFAHADVGLGWSLSDNVELGLSLVFQAFFLDGPTLDDRTVNIPFDCDPTGPATVGCIESGNALADEAAHRTFFLGSPQLHAGYQLLVSCWLPTGLAPLGAQRL